MTDAEKIAKKLPYGVRDAIKAHCRRGTFYTHRLGTAEAALRYGIIDYIDRSKKAHYWLTLNDFGEEVRGELLK